MNEFLARILEVKRHEVEVLRSNGRLLEQQVRKPQARFASSLSKGSVLGIVSEVKKASPSKGLIQPDFNPVAIAKTYEGLGAAAISVLTDKEFFQGSIHDLRAVSDAVDVPVLRKDFIIDEVQINEAVLAGADAILLICAALPQLRLEELSAFAHSSGLDVLIEIHSLDELGAALAANPSVLGINNRDLRTFAVNLQTTENIMPHVTPYLPVLSESGISCSEDARRMAATGVAGLLIGESLMRKAGTGNDLQNFFKSLQQERPAMRSYGSSGDFV